MIKKNPLIIIKIITKSFPKVLQKPELKKTHKYYNYYYILKASVKIKLLFEGKN